jgi:isocitrate dehydrogenase (NAD+)
VAQFEGEMRMHEVTLIPGEGIGPEVTTAARKVIDASGARIKWDVVEAGAHVAGRYGTLLPDFVLDSIERTKVALKGPITTPIGDTEFLVSVSWTQNGKKPTAPRTYPSVNVALRKELDLYANVRPARVYPGIKTRFENVDLVVVRENTEDLYVGIERMVTPDIAEAVKILSRHGSERIVKYAFDFAVREGRRKVTAVHKANILKRTDGLFLETARGIARSYPQIEFEDRIIDNMCMQLVQFPEDYDVIVAPNLYGDILSDLTAGLVGGLGVAPGANVGTDATVFEPVHGTAPAIAGQNKANPTATILSAVMMLRQLGETEAAARVHNALVTVLSEGRQVTADIGGSATTTQMADAVVAAM